MQGPFFKLDFTSRRANISLTGGTKGGIRLRPWTASGSWQAGRLRSGRNSVVEY
ncbi:MAG: hypothetical protein ACK4WF_09140 [Candidatus Brocadiales bacterium]